MNTTNLNINMESIPWIEKYRPRKLDEMTQEKNLLDLFKNSISVGNISHFLLYGPPGTGKTSAILAMGRELFKEHFHDRVIEFNASDDRGINAVREKITHEAKKYVTSCPSKDGTIIPPYKIIILDEADSMTDEAQDALRVIIEQYSTVTRFCFICNYISKITDAIKSRCSVIHFKKLSSECMVDRLNDIAVKESMVLPENILKTIIDVSTGDMRKAIMMLQNLKYLYNFKKTADKPIIQMSNDELKSLLSITYETIDNRQITEKDIYEMATFIDANTANEIIHHTILCKNLIEITKLTQKIIATGFPIDNMLIQLNKAVLKNKILTDEEKAKILIYSGNIFYKIRECSSEYIQLLDYLSAIHGIKNKNLAYRIK